MTDQPWTPERQRAVRGSVTPVLVRFTPEQLKAMKRCAKRDALPLAEWIRRACRDALER